MLTLPHVCWSPCAWPGDSAVAGALAMCLALAMNDTEVNRSLPCAWTSVGLMNFACCSCVSAVTMRLFLGSSVVWGTDEGHVERTIPYSFPASPT